MDGVRPWVTALPQLPPEPHNGLKKLAPGSYCGLQTEGGDVS